MILSSFDGDGEVSECLPQDSNGILGPNLFISDILTSMNDVLDSFRNLWKSFREQTVIAQVFLIVFFTAFWFYGGAKNNSGTGDPPTSPLPSLVMTTSAPGTNEVTSCDAEYFQSFYLDRLSGFYFGGISVGPNGVELSVNWQRWIHDMPPSADVYVSTSLVSRVWQIATNVPFASGITNVNVTIQPCQLPSLVSNQMFFLPGAPTDMDGDRLSDDYELLISRTNPAASDTDQDGAPDKLELEQGTNPLVYDCDGDGIPDGRELASGSNPFCQDTDNDGLSDGVELGNVMVSADADFLWFDMTSATDLLPTNEVSTGLSWNMPLLNPIQINSFACTNVIICSDGFIHLANPIEDEEFQCTSLGADLASDSLSLHSWTVAACNTNLYVRPADWQSKLLFGRRSIGGMAYTVFEYRNFACGSNPGAPKITFQVVLPENEQNTAYVSYHSADEDFSAYPNANGIQKGSSYDGCPAPYAFALKYPACMPFPAIGKTFKYQIGTGTMAANADSDNDGLSDGDELAVYHTDPLDRDTDGDGFSDGCEIRNGWNPSSRGDYNGGVLPDGANESAYYRIGVTPPESDARIVFVGEGYSDLVDPEFQMHHGTTNAVRLLIGKHYTVTSSVPISCAWVSDTNVVVNVLSTNAFSVIWPVTFEYVDYEPPTQWLMAGSSTNNAPKTIRVKPSGLDGVFEVSPNACCISSSPEGIPVFGCQGNCGCGGCYTGTISYRYQGLKLNTNGFSCPCNVTDPDDGDGSHENPPESMAAGSVRARFSKPAIIFEDAYTDSPGHQEPRRSTTSTLSIHVKADEDGGTLVINTQHFDRLRKISGSDLPTGQVTLMPNEYLMFNTTYEGQEESVYANDIEVFCRYSSTGSASSSSDNDSITVFHIKITSLYSAPLNESLERHKYGVNEPLKCEQSPSTPLLTFQINDSNRSDLDGHLLCPLENTVNPLLVSYMDVKYRPNILVIVPSIIEAREVACIEYGLYPGMAGGVGLRSETYIGPFDVSFQNIIVEEIPTDMGFHSGYFSDPQYSTFWAHSVNNGAGKWNHVDSNNKFSTMQNKEQYKSHDWLHGEKYIKSVIPTGGSRMSFGGALI